MAATTVITPISPSFVSTDLLTPHQKDRITIPSIGYHAVHRRPIGGKTWGTNLTDYGGIGKLPFLGRSRARDLYVTRSLKHFGSGFSQHKTEVQPYQLTSLMKSACRVNDQTVPRTFDIELDPQRYKLDKYEDMKNKNPYFSHQYIFEVFPHHDPNRAYLPGNVLMSRRTREDLRKKYKSLYSIPRGYPDHSDVIRSRANHSAPSERDQDLSLESHTQYDPDDAFQAQCTNQNLGEPTFNLNYDETDCMSCSEYQFYADFVSDMAPFCSILSQIGKKLGLFSARDIFCLVMQYYGSAVVDITLERIRAAIADDKSLHLLEKALGDYSSFVVSKIIPLVSNLDLEGISIHEVIVGTVKEPQAKPKEVKRQVDARKQYPTLRSFNIGTNATSFDHTLSHMKNKEKEENVKPGFMPVWPPSGCYVLNKQRMKLESSDSFPKNVSSPGVYLDSSDSETKNISSPHVNLESSDSETKNISSPHVNLESSDSFRKNISSPHVNLKNISRPLPAIRPQGDAEAIQMSSAGEVKRVRFADAALNDIISLDDPHPGTSAMGLQWYRKYMDSILPHSPSQSSECTEGQMMSGVESGWRVEDSDADGREVAVPPILCRYPPSPPSVTRGHWSTCSIVDPNQHLKTLAQRRYHLLHPDPVPDLRENHRFSKKYFFSGYHTSTFRG